MSKSVVFLFSGQGSQYYQMGRNLFNNDPIFRNEMLRLDKIAQKISGNSIIDVLYNEENKKSTLFNDITYTHPAIFMLEYSVANTLRKYNIEPDYVMGTSLGEFVSLAVAGIADEEVMMEMVIKQAEYIKSQCSYGNMIAIVHNKELYNNEPILNENSELISVNFNSHFVISTEMKKLPIIIDFFKKQRIVYQILPVKYGFHTHYIDNAEVKYKEYLRSKEFQSLKIPCISCVTGEEIDVINQDYFWDCVRKPMLFMDALESIEKDKECIYIDLGPSGTLANFAKYNLEGKSESEIFPIITQFEKDTLNLDKVLNRLKY